MNKSMQVYNQLKKQFKEISKQLDNLFEQIFKKMDQEIKVLENMARYLQNKDYLTFKSQIHILKQFYSKENENYKQKQILQLNNINNTIKNILSDLTQEDGSFNSCHLNDIKIVEINQKIESHKQLNTKEAEILVTEGFALYNLNKYQEAIECYDIAITINPQNDAVWYYKGNALNKLNKYQEAIECYDKSITINPKDDKVQYNKGIALNKLNKYQEAIECYDKAITINPKHDSALSNKGLTLHKLKKYKNAIICYDQALSVSITPLNLLRKADSLFELGNKQEAKQYYLDALQYGSTRKDYIQKQLQQL
ncbi:unnamed protein product [Paramecium octaurelia]|uniref:Tetratricopeptide repeat protein n=1 Tax=Paramecium octaurelia TaxID=43137 RepID=A0A8S1YQR1_PAROT|nr:unnamed protein product [Paramecium octaurelia]